MEDLGRFRGFASDRDILMKFRECLEKHEIVLSNPPRSAVTLGFAGLLPFAALGLAALVAPDRHGAWAEELLIGYAAIILSFMGGCRWGFASAGLGDGPTFRQLVVSVLPALFAWMVALLDFEAAALAIAVGFAALYLADRALTRARGAPAWWTVLRLPLTVGAVIALVVPTIV